MVSFHFFHFNRLNSLFHRCFLRIRKMHLYGQFLKITKYRCANFNLLWDHFHSFFGNCWCDTITPDEHFPQARIQIKLQSNDLLCPCRNFHFDLEHRWSFIQFESFRWICENLTFDLLPGNLSDSSSFRICFH